MSKAASCNRVSTTKVCLVLKLVLTAGGDEPPDDINKLKTKVRRLYDIANLLTTLKLIAKVHMPPSRRPAFVWLGIEGIDVQQQAAAQEQATTSPASLTAVTASHSEAASSTATGSSMQDHAQLRRHLSSGTLNTSSMTQADSTSTFSKGLKRGAVPLEPSSALKCARTALLEPSNILYGTVTSPQRPPPPASFHAQQTHEDTDGTDPSEGSAEHGCSPAMGQQVDAGGQGKLGLRPTPVPITPEGGQPDGAQQRHEVSLFFLLMQESHNCRATSALH